MIEQAVQLKPGERYFNFPREDPPPVDLEASRLLRPARGSYIAKMDPPPETSPGGIVLPNQGNGYQTRMGVAGILRADAGTVLAAGAQVPLVPGTRTLIAPYSGHRFQQFEGVEDMVVVGDAEDNWRNLTPMSKAPGCEWALEGNWLRIHMDVEDESAIYVIRPQWKFTGTVTDTGPSATWLRGKRVVVSSDIAIQREDDTRWFGVVGEGWSERDVLVRESAWYGDERFESIEAIIEE